MSILLKISLDIAQGEPHAASKLHAVWKFIRGNQTPNASDRDPKLERHLVHPQEAVPFLQQVFCRPSLGDSRFLHIYLLFSKDGFNMHVRIYAARINSKPINA